jgi:Nucleoside-diphosphate-sugar epimerases
MGPVRNNSGTARLIKVMAKVLVTGATGNVGREATAQLLSAGIGVRAFVRDPRTTRLPEGVEIAEGT